jgi:hypothetical protein
MSGRRKTRRCRNCPDTAPLAAKPVEAAAAKIATKYQGKKLDENLVTREVESNQLWNHVLFGTSTCVGMIEGYADLGLPGNPVPQIAELIRRLANVAKKYENTNAN